MPSRIAGVFAALMPAMISGCAASARAQGRLAVDPAIATVRRACAQP